MITLPPKIEAGIADVAQRGGWNRPAPASLRPADRDLARVRRAPAAMPRRCGSKLARGEITAINDFITYNLNIRQFAQDVIAETAKGRNCCVPSMTRSTVSPCLTRRAAPARFSLPRSISSRRCIRRASTDGAFVGEPTGATRDCASEFRQALDEIAAHPNRHTSSSSGSSSTTCTAWTSWRRRRKSVSCASSSSSRRR